MKTFILAVLLLPAFSLTANAGYRKVLSKISLDLDSDGKADIVRVVDYGRDSNSLEILWSNRQPAQSFDNILGGTEKGAKAPINPMEFAPSLKVLSATSFKIHESRVGLASHFTGDLDIIVVASEGKLLVNSSVEHGGEHGGDVSNGRTESYDFVAGKATLDDWNRATYDGGPWSKTVERDLYSCRPTLAEWNPRAILACAKLPE